jgi:nucleoside-diphosphate-sugar epimerase
MKIGVIGGCGFIGRRAVRLLASEGHEVVCMDVHPVPVFDDLGLQVRLVRADVAQFEDVVSALASHRPHTVINLSYLIGDYLPRAAMKVNVLGMDNCFEAARLCDVGHVVYGSSIAVYGSQHPYGMRPIEETDPVHPSTQYAVHKVFNDWQATEYREKHGMCITGVRAANVGGVDKVLGSVDHVQCVTWPAAGRQVRLAYRDRMRCLIYVDDIAEVFVRIALKARPDFTTYNSGGESLSFGDLADMVTKVIPEADIAFEHETGGLTEPTAGPYLFSTQRLEREFGIRHPPYAQRVVEMIDIARRNP